MTERQRSSKNSSFGVIRLYGTSLQTGYKWSKYFGESLYSTSYGFLPVT